MSDKARDYGFLRRPKWIAGHLIVVIAAVVFVNMGFWQLRRLAERQDFNDRLTSRSAQPPQPLDEILASFGPDQDQLELRSVVATGVYRVDDEVILRSRSFNGLSGHHVLTPLELGDGRVLIVDRGWVSIDIDQPGVAETVPPSGTVEVVGVLRKNEERGSFGPVDPAEGTLTQIARVDLDRLAQQVEGEVLPLYVQLQSQVPAPAVGLPMIVDLPEPSEGSHRGYAVQWFLFAAVALVGYPILLLRTAESDTGDTDPTA